jgi:hypothetical protein
VKSHVFKVVIEEDALEDGRRAFHASCPALKGCHTWGHTPEEALTNVDEAWHSTWRICGRPASRFRLTRTAARWRRPDMPRYIRDLIDLPERATAATSSSA